MLDRNFALNSPLSEFQTRMRRNLKGYLQKLVEAEEGRIGLREVKGKEGRGSQRAGGGEGKFIIDYWKTVRRDTNGNLIRVGRAREEREGEGKGTEPHGILVM